MKALRKKLNLHNSFSKGDPDPHQQGDDEEGEMKGRGHTQVVSLKPCHIMHIPKALKDDISLTTYIKPA